MDRVSQSAWASNVGDAVPAFGFGAVHAVVHAHEYGVHVVFGVDAGRADADGDVVIEIAHAFQKASQGFLGVARRIDDCPKGGRGYR